MTWHLIASINSVNGATTTTVNTTGADLIVIAVSDFANGATPSDNQANTYTQVGPSESTTRQIAKIFACKSPTTSASHTFTPGGNNGWNDVQVWSGSASGTLTAITDASSGGKSGALGSTTVQPGSITPTQSNELIVCSLTLDDPSTTTPPTINSSFTVSTWGAETAGSTFGSGFSYLVQSAANPINPTWTRPNAGTNSAGQDGSVIVSFKGFPLGQVPYTPWPQLGPILAS